MSELMKMNDKFEFKHNNQGDWTLFEWVEGVNPKTKEKTRKQHKTYHPTLSKVCNAILEKEAGAAKDIKDIIDFIDLAKAELRIIISYYYGIN